jgi:hypothetical protein
MKLAHFRERYRELANDPSALLAYSGLRQSMKRCNLMLGDGYVIVIIPAGFCAQSYKKAAHVLLDMDSEEWGVPRTRVRLANPPKKKGSIDTQPSIFDLRGLRLLIATHINEVPKDVRFVANRIVPLQPPTIRDINAVRHVLRLPLLAKEHAGELVGKSENVILAGILKREWSADDTVALNDIERLDIYGPSLFDLPGYHELKHWGRGIAMDVDRWRHGALDWKDVTRGVVLSGPTGVGRPTLLRRLPML